MADLSTGLTQALVSSGQRDVQLVTFRIGDYEFGADVSDVRGIYHGLPMIPTPDAPDVLAGDVQICGERISVFNLSSLYANPESRATDWWIIVLNLLGGPVGFKVEKVTEVVRLKVSALATVPNDEAHPLRNYVSAVAQHQGRTIRLVDFTAMLKEHLQ